MQRLMEIKNRLEVIEEALNEQYPRFKADPDITGQITDLKDYVQEERKSIQKQKARGELSEFESAFIEPAINDVYLSSLDKSEEVQNQAVALTATFAIPHPH